MNKKQKFIVQGLSGKKTLNGHISINGAKNSALKAMAASVLFGDEVVLNNIPNTEDIHTMKDILVDLGAKVEWLGGNSDSKTIKIDTKDINKTDINPNLAITMRASVVLTGPILARFGKVSFPAPGGCVIGARPIDLFIDGYKKMGATITLKDGLYHIEAPQGLKGAEINFSKISVGGTETLMMAGVFADGTTVLRNCAKEPEIVNIAEWLNLCGAEIKGVGTDTIIIKGNDRKLLKSKEQYTAIPDRIEAGSFLILGSLCALKLYIDDCRPDHLEKTIELLREAGVSISIEGNEKNPLKTIVVTNDPSRPDFRFKTFNVETREYPGFPTDLQSPIVTFLTQSEGESSVVEKIFEGRFKYVEDLNVMGADITMIDQERILIKGPTSLRKLNTQKEFSAHDIRAGFAMVLACLIGDGEYVINNIHLIDRGYEKLEERLVSIGANIKRIIG
jgi:UDP-N-acetylglucosamine 1-carboxyvinyltransferase